MAGFQTLLAGLKRAETQLQRQLEGVRNALAALESGATGTQRGRPASAHTPRRRRRRLSAAGRAKLRASAKRRWAEARKAGRTRLS
jgi:hypothetical protein